MRWARYRDVTSSVSALTRFGTSHLGRNWFYLADLAFSYCIFTTFLGRYSRHTYRVVYKSGSDFWNQTAVTLPNRTHRDTTLTWYLVLPRGFLSGPQL